MLALKASFKVGSKSTLIGASTIPVGATVSAFDTSPVSAYVIIPPNELNVRRPAVSGTPTAGNARLTAA
ncbi:MAG: hypothetical protein ACP5M7_10010, partial [Thermoproteota archaeon]